MLEKQLIGARVPRSLWAQVKIESLRRGQTLEQVVTAALEGWLNQKAAASPRVAQLAEAEQLEARTLNRVAPSRELSYAREDS